MAGYGKFFSSAFTGSMVGIGCDVFAVWGYVIANAGADSTVELNPDLLAAILGATPERIREAISTLCSPDPRSRSPDHEGRRLLHEGAFTYRVTMHAAYRAMRNDEDRRIYNRVKQQESRARRSSRVSPPVNDSQSKSTLSAHTESEADAEEAAAVVKQVVNDKNVPMGPGFDQPVGNRYPTECHLCHHRLPGGVGIRDGSQNGKVVYRHAVCPDPLGDIDKKLQEAGV